MSDKHLDPARAIIKKIGPAKVAEITGKSISRVYRWMYPKSRGGTGGLIPYEDATLILEHARVAGVALAPDDFFPSAAAAKAAE